MEEELAGKQRKEKRIRALPSHMVVYYVIAAYDEFKTHLRGGQAVLRGKTPELVNQEFYGLLMAHFSTRQLMHETALVNDMEPLRLSFAHTVEIIKRNLPASTEADFPLSGSDGLLKA